MTAFLRLRPAAFSTRAASGLWAGLVLSLLLAGCSHAPPAPTSRGEAKTAPVSSGEVGQSDVNRMATLGMRDNLDSLLRVADKLYRRNPAEWRKSAATREAALDRLQQAIDQRTPWPDLQGRRDIAALSLALAPEFKGDRVAAFVYASADMLVTAHGGKTSFFLTDALDTQYIFNAARNIEVAVWLLSSRRNTAGQPLLLADEISERERNLSFEREFGKVIGRLDLLAEVLTEKYRRAVISYVQNLMGGTFLQFLPVR
ncbi:MAG: putative lipoprotein [Polaromonas sp.]|nr:putative lipoprotein [Polaromonas sp.]